MILLKRTFDRLLELIETMPMPIMEVDEKKKEIIVRNINGSVAYYIDNYTDEELHKITEKVTGKRYINEREEKALEILKDFLDNEIDLSNYDTFYQVYDFIEESYEEETNEITGQLIMCVDGYKVYLDMGVKLDDGKVYVYSAENYQECTTYSKQFLTEFIYQIILSVKAKDRCDK